MKVTVFGTKTWKMVDEKSGEVREGITAHYTGQSVDSRVRGLEYGKFSVYVGSPMYGVVAAMPLPAELELTFNRFGKVQDFEVLDQVK